MRIALAVLLAASTLALAGCSGGGGGTPAAQGQTHDIAMHNAMFEPSTITLAKGDILHFEAHDVKHAARTSDGHYNTGDLCPQDGCKHAADVTMDAAGTFQFQCPYHAGMRLTATVTG